jgi:pimeloyl-ACP methyl ester carboxylesterase
VPTHTRDEPQEGSDHLGGTPTIVLVHGAGHTSEVWRSTQEHLRHASVAVDIPGRRSRRADVTAVTIDAAADSIAADVRAATHARVVLVGHSAGGILLPAVAARLGARVDHLVFVAGLSARDGLMTADTVKPGHSREIAARAAELRERYRDHMLAPDALDDALAVIDDERVAMTIDSLNFLTQVVSWEGVPASLGRTFVRCLSDPIQSPSLQAELIENCGASRVIDIDTGHTPALDDPQQLAAILDHIADAS